MFVVRVSPPYSPNLCLPPRLLIEAIHSLARPLSSSGSLLDPCPELPLHCTLARGDSPAC